MQPQKSGLDNWAVGAQEIYFGKNLTVLELSKTLNIEQEILRHMSTMKILTQHKLLYKKCADILWADRKKD